MSRLPPSNRNDHRAVRPTSARGGVVALPGVGEARAFGPSPAEIGQATIQKSEGENGSAIIAIMFTSPLMAYMRDSDLNGFKALAMTGEHMAVAMSKGPYSLKMLAQMGHPYAKNRAVQKPRPTSRKTHNVPRFQPNKAIGHIKGIRGSVPTLTVTNIQSGHFADSWSHEVVKSAGHVSAIWRNSAEYAFYLMEGTDKMIAHSPFEYVVRLMLPQFNAEWARIVTMAWRRQPQTKAVKAARMA